MTMPIKFDTLEYARRLAEAGIPPDQADAHAQALSDALATASVAPAELVLVLVRSELLARMDMLKSEVYARIDMLKSEIYSRIDLLKSEIDALEARMNAKFKVVYWLTGLSLATSALTLATQVFMMAKILP
ncbi:hypothetical protein SAMN05428959_106286 [Duganella sp. CF517]|uniref:hypothetical protein n=1 Tax=Duganella sp. CF517 TaxID=1881038 RepID=UPI0008B875DD|nr:hypothetical protein [Duganella sp. CF517]SEO31892.1 hypothetical protein SAMN05428959_106286 [Duganella sp. CF517]